MKVRRSKILYMTILMGLIALALVDFRRQSQNTISYNIEEIIIDDQLVANPINNRNILEDEQANFYSLLVPCD